MPVVSRRVVDGYRLLKREVEVKDQYIETMEKRIKDLERSLHQREMNKIELELEILDLKSEWRRLKAFGPVERLERDVQFYRNALQEEKYKSSYFEHCYYDLYRARRIAMEEAMRYARPYEHVYNAEEAGSNCGQDSEVEEEEEGDQEDESCGCCFEYDAEDEEDSEFESDSDDGEDDDSESEGDDEDAREFFAQFKDYFDYEEQEFGSLWDTSIEEDVRTMEIEADEDSESDEYDFEYKSERIVNMLVGSDSEEEKEERRNIGNNEGDCIEVSGIPEQYPSYPEIRNANEFKVRNNNQKHYPDDYYFENYIEDDDDYDSDQYDPDYYGYDPHVYRGDNEGPLEDLN